MSGLWPHQQRVFADTKRSFATKHKWPLVVMPTGAGKTRLGGEFARVHTQQGGRVLWLAHREELVSQAVDALSRLGLQVGCIHAGKVRPFHPERPVQVASIQTLLARGDRPDSTMVIQDEAHHACDGNGWTEVPKHYKGLGRVGIGLTATPCRADGQGLGELFDDIVPGPSISELIESKHLVPCEIFAPKRALGKNQAKNPVESYLALTPGKKAIVFAPHIKAVEEYTDAFLRAGVPTDAVTGSDNGKLRRGVLEKFRAGDIKVLVNCAVLTEGFDDPSTEVCILARPCGSEGLYLQIVGRVLRASAGKTCAYLIDLHGVTHRFGSPEEPREYSLDGIGIKRKNLEQGDERFCQVCGALLDAPGACPDCGLSREVKIPEVVNVDLLKFAAKRREGEEKRLETLKRWVAAALEKGHKPGSAWFKFKAVYGVEPTREMWRLACPVK